jgi:hypothetical protein
MGGLQVCLGTSDAWTQATPLWIAFEDQIRWYDQRSAQHMISNTMLEPLEAEPSPGFPSGRRRHATFTVEPPVGDLDVHAEQLVRHDRDLSGEHQW